MPHTARIPADSSSSGYPVLSTFRPSCGRIAESRQFDAIVALGAVIRGETPHFDYVASECAAGLARIATETGVPVAFGVLTTDTEEQAMERAGGREGNKGADAACAAIELANLMRKLGD